MTSEQSPRDRFGLVFVGVARRWRALLDVALARSGLSDATWAPLIHVARSGGGLSQRELAERVGIDGSSLVRLIDILTARGLVERRQDPADRRANHLFLTSAGEVAVGEVQRVLTTVETEILAGLDDAGLGAMVRALEDIDERIRALRGREDLR